MLKKTRYEVLDGLRGIAAIVVMVRHFTEYDGLVNVHNMLLLTSTALAVDFFFMLSGFVIAHSYADRLQQGMPIAEYLKRRVIRLYPMFLMGMVVGVAVLWFVTRAGDTDFPPSSLLTDFFLNASFIPYFSNYGVKDIGADKLMRGDLFPIDPPAWSLFFEMFISFGFVFFYKLKKNQLIRLALAALILLTIYGGYQGHLDHYVGLNLNIGWGSVNFAGGFARVLYGFVMGVLLYHLHQEEKFSGKFLIGNSYTLYALLVLVLAFPNNVKGIYPLFILTLAAPIMLLIGAKIECAKGLETKIAERLGWYSYPIYCLHYPVGRLVWLLNKHFGLPESVLVCIAVTATVLVSFALTKIVEEPSRRFLSNVWLKRTSEA